ncbi:Mu transposase C-terminal domain-containing protein [Variovorax sp. GB1R11]|uniref:Mu transposase C-terminal domain-containing protein n=1 Tax=Variovorax sp. GB1R11 TaxID=3443741 RepID=UPI003F46A9A1
MTDPRHRAAPLLKPREGMVVKTEDGKEFVILRFVGLMKVMAKELGTEELATLDLDELGFREVFRRGKKIKVAEQVNLDDVDSHDWEIAEHRRKILTPLLAMRTVSKEAREQACAELEISQATLYRLMHDLYETQLLSSLLPYRPSGGRGKNRLSDELEHVIQDGIKNHYLTGQKIGKKALVEKIEADCAVAGIKPPAPNTIRSRIDEIEEKKRAKKRKGEAEARKFEANKTPGRGNKLPDADYPLAIAQMDHTLLDIIVVDDKYRKAIRRAWITVLIDCYSRVILGFYVSLDPPSSLSAGLCITNAILTKRQRLEELGLTNQVEWPYYGVMDVVHMDNAKEFRGKLIEFGCKEHHIDAHFRPVKNPKYGAIIERFMGTLASKIKALPGATFSNPKERGEYDSEKTATMTLTELESWLYLTIEKYHLEKHSTLNMPPAQKWKEGILGTKTKPGRGRPALIQDAEKLRIDLLPFQERVIHPEGVVIDRIVYFHDCLRPYVNIKDPKTKTSVYHRFGRDPRDVSVLYFRDPIQKQYVRIPYADPSLPPGISQWEYDAAQRIQEDGGGRLEDTRAVMAIVLERRKREQESAETTKTARQNMQRRAEHAKARERGPVELPRASQMAPTSPPDSIAGYDPDEIFPIEEE